MVSIRQNSLPSAREKGGSSLEFTREEQDVHFNRCSVSPRLARDHGRPRLDEPVLAQSTVYIPAILDYRRRPVSGTNFRDGMLLAIDEINAKGESSPQDRYAAPRHAERRRNLPRPGPKSTRQQPYVILGPVFSGSVLVICPHPAGRDSGNRRGEAAAITQKGRPLRLPQPRSPAIQHAENPNYIRDSVKAKSVAVLWVNNDFGKGAAYVHQGNGRTQHQVTADISTESGQADFSADVVKIKAANADAIFVYVNEERAPDSSASQEARRQDGAIGETTLLGQKVIDLPRCSRRRARHVGLTVDAPIPAVKEFAERFKKRFNYVCDHNGIKGYTAVYLSSTSPRNGKFDSKLFAQTLHGMTITPKDEPGVLMEATFDKNGDIDGKASWARS